MGSQSGNDPSLDPAEGFDIAQQAGEHRDERLTKSLTKIPATLIHLVHTLAAALALLMFFYPFHNWVAGMCCFLLVAGVLFLANLVMTVLLCRLRRGSMVVPSFGSRA